MLHHYFLTSSSRRSLGMSLSLLMGALLSACGGGGGGATSAVSTATAPKFAQRAGRTTGQASQGYTTGSASQDYRSPLNRLSFTQASSSSQTASFYAQATSGNRTWNDTIHRVDTTADKSLTYEKNFFDLVRNGVLPVFAQRDFTTSARSQSRGLGFDGRDIYLEVPSATQLSKAPLQGTGVNVALIDGKVLGNHWDFLHTPQEIRFKADANSVAREAESPLLEDKGIHGTFVARVIAGQRGALGVGIAPDVQLATLALRSNDLNTGNYFKLVRNYKFTSTGSASQGTDLGDQVHIINNSYSLGTMLPSDRAYLKQLEARATSGSTSATPSATAVTSFTSLYRTLEDWRSQATSAPLLVFATGNLEKPLNLSNDRLELASRGDAPYVRFLKSYVDHDYYSTMPEQRQGRKPQVSEATRRALEDPYFIASARKINTSNFNSDEHVLTNLLKYSGLADNIITVTGYTFNDSGKNSEIIRRIKDYVLDGTIDGKDVRKEVEDNWDSIKTQASNFPYVILNPGALACGETKYSCLAASFTYNFPSDETGAPTPTSKSGTSFGTPQVSAVAALVKQQFDWMTAAQLKQTLLTTALDAGQPGVDDIFGWGLLNGIGAVNGPMLFNAGDFEAKLDRVTQVGKNYYFNNNIYGSGGLRVSGGSSDYLYLTGVNQFTGDLVVDSANLVVVNRHTVGITQPECTSTSNGSCYIRQPYIAANTYVNRDGKLYAVHATFAQNLTINGLASLAYTQVGNLYLQPQATLVIDLQARNNRIEVLGTADLRGNIKLRNSNYYTPSTTQDYVFLRANNLNYQGQITVDDQGLVNTEIYQDGKRLGIRASARTPTHAVPVLASSQGLGTWDRGVLATGAHHLDNLFVQADQLATQASAQLDPRDEQQTATPSALTPSARETVASSDTTAPSSRSNNEATSLELKPTALAEWKQQQGLQLSADASSTTANLLSSDSSAMPASVPSVSLATNQSGAPTDARLLAGQLQKLPSAQQTAFIAGMAGTSYASLQQLATYGLRTGMTDFTHAVQQARLGTQAYLNWTSGTQTYQLETSQLSADAQQQQVSVGVTTQWQGLNLGIAAQLGKLQLEEYFDGDYATRLHSAMGNSTSLSTSLAYNHPHYYLVGNLTLATHEFNATRENLNLAPNLAEFRANQALLELGTGYHLYQAGPWQITLGAGLTSVLTQQNAFSETTRTAYATALNLEAQQRVHATNYLNLAAILRYDLRLVASTRSQLEVQARSSYAWQGNDWRARLRTAQSSQAFEPGAQVFDLDWASQLKVSWNLEFSPYIKLSFAGQYLHSSNFRDTSAQSQLLFKF